MESNPLRDHVLSVNEEVSDPSKQIGNIEPSSLACLPVGLAKEINGSTYVVAIDSAWFTPFGAFFNAYAALELPGTTEKLAFAAKGIQFNPEGVIGGAMARLMLVSNHTIPIGPKVNLELKGDGTNYVEWDCNGFTAVHLKGNFVFDRSIIVPDSQLTAADKVTASFETHTNDLHNIVVATSITPFCVRGMNDFGFSVTNAVVDMSDFANVPGMIFPSNYPELYGGNPFLWRGFYLKQFKVRLPDEYKTKTGLEKTIEATNILIDDAGISGVFGMTNALTLEEGDMFGWPFSVSDLGIELLMNNLNGGYIKGKIQVPALDNGLLAYEASLHKNTLTNKVDYLFAVSPSSSYTMSCFFANAVVYNSSKFIIERKQDRFKPRLILNGKIGIGNSNLQIAQLNVEQLTLVTDAPYITNGIFNLSTGTPSNHKLGNFPIVLNSLTVGVYNGQPTIGAFVGLNLGDTSTTNFSIATHAKVISKVTTSPLSGYSTAAGENSPVKTDWTYDRVKVDDVLLSVTTQPFTANGVIGFRDDDPIYGKGFFGKLVFSFDKLLEGPITVDGIFGQTSFKYWSFDIGVPLNKKIPGTQVTVEQLRGGLSYRMKPNKSTAELIHLAFTTPLTVFGSGVRFVPDESTGLSIRAGMAFNYAREELLNGDVLLTTSFASSGGISDINLLGEAYMLVKRNERKTGTKYVKASLLTGYDAEHKVFDFLMNGYMQYSGILTGNVNVKAHIDPDKWYFWAGRPSAPAFINVANLASGNAYLMVGQELEAMAPPPSNLTAVFNDNNLGSQRNVSEINSGNGYAVGLSFSSYFDKAVGWDNFELYGSGSIGAGFDMTMYKYAPTVRCAGSSTLGIGMNNWYLNGRLYAWLSVNAGIRGNFSGNNFDITLVSANAAVLLNGKLPKPTFVEAKVHLDATVLEFIHVDVDFDFSFGEDCTIVNG